MIAEKWDLSREEMEEFALRSHERALRRDPIAATSTTRSSGRDGDGPFRVDEGPRETSLEKMAGLKTLAEGGRLTAAVASQISDGSSAVLLASEQAVKDHGSRRGPASTTSARAAPTRC